MAQAVAGEHRGCRVSGRVLTAAGEQAVTCLTVRPGRSAKVNGVIYNPVVSQITVGLDGRWSAVLMPSSLVGPYRVTIGREVYSMIVPDQQEAAFDKIAERFEPKSARTGPASANQRR